jgi:hypothetical protein
MQARWISHPRRVDDAAVRRYSLGCWRSQLRSQQPQISALGRIKQSRAAALGIFHFGKRPCCNLETLEAENQFRNMAVSK